MAGLLGDGIVIPMQPPAIAMGGILDGGGGVPGRSGGRRKEERIPQWGFHETKEFIAIRAEFEKEFTQTKRNKTLWEQIAARMKDKGFRRSADQCKCKWKNLVNRYKGKEISEPDNGRQCPFYEELDTIFRERSKNLLLLESEGMRPTKRLRKLKGGGGLLSDEESDEEEDDEESDDEIKSSQQQLQHFQPQQQQIQLAVAPQHQHQQQQHQQQQQQQQRTARKRKVDKERQRSTAEKSRASSMQEVLEDFFQQQQRNEEQWRVSLEQREMERRAREQEWRECMEKLERERAVREQAWWDREEQRRLRDEARSRKRDELVEAVLRKVMRDDC